MSEETTTRISFSYPDDIKTKLEKMAEKDRRTLANLIKIIIDDHLTSLKEG